MSEKDGTGAGVAQHWNWAAKRGLMNDNTEGALRSACTQVLAVEENWESLDIRNLDVDDFVKRFENLRKKDFTPQSLATYGSRFRRAVKSYLDYLDNPTSWRFEGRERVPKSERDRQRPSASRTSKTPNDGYTVEMVTYPFPVRSGVMAEIVLPADLSSSEANRLAAFLESVAIDEPRQLPPGQSASG